MSRHFIRVLSMQQNQTRLDPMSSYQSRCWQKERLIRLLNGNFIGLSTGRRERRTNSPRSYEDGAIARSGFRMAYSWHGRAGFAQRRALRSTACQGASFPSEGPGRKPASWRSARLAGCIFRMSVGCVSGWFADNARRLRLWSRTGLLACGLFGTAKCRQSGARYGLCDGGEDHCYRVARCRCSSKWRSDRPP